MTIKEAKKIKVGDKVKFKDGTFIYTVTEIKEDNKDLRFGLDEFNNYYPRHKLLERVEK